MDAITAARELLPAWVPWGNVLLYVPAAFLISFVSAWAGAALALRPLRKANPATWVERARLSYPVRAAAARTAVFLPLLFGVLTWAHDGAVARVRGVVFIGLSVLAAYAGALLVSRMVARRTRPAPGPARAWLRGQFVLLLVLYPHLLVMFVLLACFPTALNARAVAVLILGAVALALCAWGGGLSLARAVGLARRPSARLAAVVERAVARVGTRPRAVYELPARLANALAFPLSGRLAFTDGALAALDDEELTAVCAHELAHLAEPRRLALARAAPLALVLALPLARLMSSAEGLLVFEAGFLAAALVAGLGRRLSRRLEGRADELARAHEGEPGAYARALAKIYEVNQVPPVLRGKGTTHPHLYDRLVAAGSPPAYERPPPPPRLFARSALTTVLLAALGCAALEAGHFPPLADTRGRERRAYWLLALYGGAPQLANLALERYQAGDKDAALALYRAAAAADEASAFYPANLAIVLAGVGRCEEAEAAAREAVERLRRKAPSRGESEAVSKAWDALDWCRARRGKPPRGWAGPPRDAP